MDQHSKVGFPVEMAFRDPLEIHREHQVTVDDEIMLRQQIQGLQKSSCVSHGFFFREDPNPEAKSRTIANEVMDFLGKMTRKDCYFIDPCTRRQFQLVLEHRLAANRNQHFGQIPSNGSQTDAWSTCNND